MAYGSNMARYLKEGVKKTRKAWDRRCFNNHFNKMYSWFERIELKYTWTLIIFEKFFSHFFNKTKKKYMIFLYNKKWLS